MAVPVAAFTASINKLRNLTEIRGFGSRPLITILLAEPIQAD
jgi:hypothetical protein